MSKRLLITGIGRSGTRYMAELLTAAGIPCGHEALYPTHVRAPPDWGEAVAESAWPAAPWVGPDHDRDLVVVHLVRNPLDWLASWTQTVWDDPRRTRSTKYLRRHTGIDWVARIADRGVLPAACELWCLYNELAARHASHRLQVERVDAFELEALFRMTGRQPPPRADLEVALGRVPTNVNARRHGALCWSDVPDCPERRRMVALGVWYGYDLPRWAQRTLRDFDADVVGELIDGAGI